MKNKKNFYLKLLTFICSPIFMVAGVLLIRLCEFNRLIALGGILICIALFALTFGFFRIITLRTLNKEKQKQEFAEKQKNEKLLNDALNEFKNKTDYPKTNTIKLVNEGLEFFAEGRYVCQKDFKNIQGHHLAFEISGTKLKYMPKNYDDVCDLEGNGVYIVIGYHDGEALEEYANDNGVILQNEVENCIGQIITLKPDNGYNAYIWTADGDEIDYGFVKILKCKNDCKLLRLQSFC